MIIQFILYRLYKYEHTINLIIHMIRQYLKLNSSKYNTFHAHKQREIKVRKHN